MMRLQAFSRRSVIVLASLAAIVALATPAHATFSYSVTPATITGGTGGSTLTVTASGGASGLVGPQSINLASIEQTSTTTNGTDVFDVSTLLHVKVTNTESGNSGTFDVLGVIHVTRSDSTGAFSFYTLTSITPASLTLGSYLYSLAGPSYTPPTIGGSGGTKGALSIGIIEGSAVPEPASMALMGIGVVALAGFGLRRRGL